MARRGAVADELTMLRNWKRNAELELALRKQQDSAGAPGEEENLRPANSPIDGGLKPRGNRQHFKITVWEEEKRIERVRSTSLEETNSVETIPIADSTESTAGLAGEQQAAEQEVERPAASSLELNNALQGWILQPKLVQATRVCRGPFVAVHEQLMSIRAELASLSIEVIGTRVHHIFVRHLEDRDQPHLGFSAAVPLLYNIFQEAVKSARSSGGTAPECNIEVRDAFSQCASVIRHLMRSARFGKSPPRRKPDNIARADYVRELCAQLGLCLDLARLRFVHSKHLKAKRASTKPGALVPFRSAAQQTATEGTLTEESVCVDREEVKDCLSRAGKYLAAVQMDMDRHHDTIVEQVRQAQAAKAAAELPEMQESDAEETSTRMASRSASPQPLGDQDAGAEAAEGDVNSRFGIALGWQQALAQALTDKQQKAAKEDQVLALLAAATATPEPTGAMETSGKSNVAVQEDSSPPDSLVPLLTPTFGEFLANQLLPLYVADIPFETLGHLSDKYCGIPLDSDDERKAFKLLGLPSPRSPKRPAARKAASTPLSVGGGARGGDGSGGGPFSSQETSTTTHSRGAHSPSAASVVSSTSTTVASALGSSPRAAVPSLAPLIELAKANMAPPMRQQMNTSIMAKRYNQFKTPRDMETSVITRSRSRRNIAQWPAASPIIRPSAALLQSPPATPGDLAVSRLALIAPSPVSMRKTSRGRVELQASTRSTLSRSSKQTTRGRSRSPKHERTPRSRGKWSPSYSVRTPCLKRSLSQPDWNLLDTPAR